MTPFLEQYRLGHRSIEVTYRIYRHLMPSAWDRARAVLDEAYVEAAAINCSGRNRQIVTTLAGIANRQPQRQSGLRELMDANRWR